MLNVDWLITPMRTPCRCANVAIVVVFANVGVGDSGKGKKVGHLLHFTDLGSGEIWYKK